MANERILAVEDDQALLEVLKYNLVKEGYNVFTANDGARALEVASTSKPELVILDIMLPTLSGLEVCRILRKSSNVPIIMLTAKDDEVDKIVGLEIGADDYVTKPFSMKELLARVRAMLRRAAPIEAKILEEKTLIRANNIEVDTARRQVLIEGKPVELTPKEFDLLTFLVKNKGLAFSREQLLEKVWGYDYAGETRTVDVHIRWLREKVEANPERPERLLTVRGFGYKLVE